MVKPIEWSIIHELMKDSRLSIAKLAKKIKKDRHIASYYRDSLLKSKVIKGAGIELDYQLLGYESFVVYLKIFGYKEMKEKIQAFLESHPNAIWAAEIFPEYGLRIVFLARDLDDFEKIYEQLEETCEGRIIEKEFLFEKEFLKRGNYSIETMNKRPKSLGKLVLKKQEIKLIKALFKNSMEGLLSLSKKTGMSVEGVRKKINQFTELGLIKPIVRIDKKKVGTSFHGQLVLRVDNFSKYRAKLEEYLTQIHFGRTRKMFGSWNLEFTLLVADHDELIEIVDSLEVLFKKDLDKYKLFITSHPILSYRLPKALFA